MSVEAVPLYLLQPAFRTPEIEKAEDRFNEKWHRIHRLDDEIFHYTDASGLVGIAQKRTLWASHYSTMNDPDELAYGANLIVEIAADLVQSEETPRRKKFLEELSRTSQYPMHDWYLISFCANGNLLSNWRAYSDQGRGYSLGFKFSNQTHVRPEPSTDRSWRKPYFRRVIYDQTEQRRLIQDWLIAAVDAADKTGLGGDVDRAIMTNHAVNLLWEMVACFKKEHFACEDEWRLIWTTLDTHEIEHVQFRQSGSLLVPYRVLSLSDWDATSDATQFPLNSIYYGPGLEPAVALSSVRTLLANAEKQPDIKLSATIDVKGAGFRHR